MLLDGKYARGIYTGRPTISWPFLNNGDRSSILIVRQFRCLAEYYQPGQLGIDKDPSHADAYLISETDPTPTGIGSILAITRTFARVPKTQTVPSSIALSRPSISGTFPQVFGRFRLFQPDTTLLRFDAYAAQTVTSDSGAPGFYPTGGTYTLSFGGDTTTALAHNAPAATVQSELNALTSVTNRGGLTVSGTHDSAGGFSITWNSYAAATISTGSLVSGDPYVTSNTLLNSGYTQQCQIAANGGDIMGGTFTITIFGQTTAAIAYSVNTDATIQAALNALSEVSNRGGCIVSGISNNARYIRWVISFTNAAITGSAASLTPAPCSITGSITDGAIGQKSKLLFTGGMALRTFYAASHGLSLSDTLFIKGGASYYSGIAGNFTLPDANTVAVTVSAAAAYAAAGTVTEIGKRTKTQYVPGASNVACRRITEFYLPGITPGITTADDIPIPANESDGSALLLAIFAGTGSVNIAVGELSQWKDGPILALARTTVNAANI